MTKHYNDLIPASHRIARPFSARPLIIRLTAYFILASLVVNILMLTALSLAKASELDHNIAFARAFQPVK